MMAPKLSRRCHCLSKTRCGIFKLSLTFPIFGLFTLLTTTVSYWEIFSMKRSRVEVHVIQPENSTIHPCVQLLQTVHFIGSDENTTALDTGGCPLQTFSAGGALKCLKEKSVTYVMFIGDSRLRQLYEYFWMMLSGLPRIEVQKFQEDRSRIVDGVQIDLKWVGKTMNIGILDTAIEVLKKPKRPDIIFVTSGLWGSDLGDLDSIKKYEKDLPAALIPLRELAKNNSRVIWVPQDPVKPNNGQVTTRLMNMYNSVAYSLLNNSNIHFWKSARLAAKQFYPKHYRDRYHLRSIVDQYKSQIVLNWLCNPRRENVECCS